MLTYSTLNDEKSTWNFKLSNVHYQYCVWKLSHNVFHFKSYSFSCFSNILHKICFFKYYSWKNGCLMSNVSAVSVVFAYATKYVFFFTCNFNNNKKNPFSNSIFSSCFWLANSQNSNNRLKLLSLEEILLSLWDFESLRRKFFLCAFLRSLFVCGILLFECCFCLFFRFNN